LYLSRRNKRLYSSKQTLLTLTRETGKRTTKKGKLYLFSPTTSTEPCFHCGPHKFFIICAARRLLATDTHLIAENTVLWTPLMGDKNRNN